MRPTLALVIALAMGAAAAGALAHGGATGVVKERMDIMTDMGDAMKALTKMMRGQEAYDADKVRALAQGIAAHSGEALTQKFPEGTGHAPSEALPAIWSDWDRFSRLADQLGDYAEALAQAADNPRAGGGMAGGGMMGGGMMGGGMMGGGEVTPDPEMVAQMPPSAAFAHVAEACSACHQDFREKK